MKRIVAAFGLLLALFFGAQAALRAMRSDEEIVRDLLRAEKEAFDEGSVFATLASFADDYHDASGMARGALHGAIVWAMQNRRAADGSFRYAVRLDEEMLTVTVDGDSAETRFPLDLLDEAADGAAIWSVRVEARFARRDGRWWIVQSRHETTGGKRPF